MKNKKGNVKGVVIIALIVFLMFILLGDSHWEKNNQTNITQVNNDSVVHVDPVDSNGSSLTNGRVLIFTTNSLKKNVDFDVLIQSYINALKKGGFDAIYYEVANADWTSLQNSIQSKLPNGGYLIILGDNAVVPVPAYTTTKTCVEEVKSDVRYLDFNDNDIPDEGYYVGRIPTPAITNYINTAIALHNKGGIRLTGLFEINTFYADRFNKISTMNPIHIWGHGNPTGFSTFVGEPIFTYWDFPSVNLKNTNPIIFAPTPCYAGLMKGMSEGTRLVIDEQYLAEGFLNNGASVYIANTLAQGAPAVLIDSFHSLNNGEVIGKTFIESIIEGAKTTCGPTSYQINFYGDPTLKVLGNGYTIFSLVSSFLGARNIEGTTYKNGIYTCECGVAPLAKIRQNQINYVL